MILALDVAFSNLGWAAMDKGVPVEFGTIRTKKDKRKSVKVSDDFAARSALLSQELHEIILTHKPQGIVAELPGGSQSAAALRAMAGSIGVVTGVAACHGLACEWISEGDSKKAALGKRSAVKEEAMAWCSNYLPGIEFPKAKTHFEHVADAIMAYHGLRGGILVRAFG